MVPIHRTYHQLLDGTVIRAAPAAAAAAVPPPFTPMQQLPALTLVRGRTMVAWNLFSSLSNNRGAETVLSMNITACPPVLIRWAATTPAPAAVSPHRPAVRRHQLVNIATTPTTIIPTINILITPTTTTSRSSCTTFHRRAVLSKGIISTAPSALSASTMATCAATRWRSSRPVEPSFPPPTSVRGR